jgi:flagellar protein FlaI
MHDRRIEDISCDGTEIPVFAYHNEYHDIETNIIFDKEQLNSFVISMAQRADKHVSVADPMVGGSLSDGSRVQLTLGNEVSNRGSNFTIRRFAEVPITPVDLIAWNTFSAETMAYLWLALENNMALLFTGGTASGKTTSLNAVSMFIPRKSKVISIEDTREITIPHNNWIQNTTRESYSGGSSSDIDMYDLLQASLRQRPEYLIVGEIRTQPDVALTFFQAMATGHTACTTFHADSIGTVLSRLQNSPLQVPEQMIQELDIICVQRQVQRGETLVRRNTNITEVCKGDGLQRHQMYEWDPKSDKFESQAESKKLESLRHTKGWSVNRLQQELCQRAEFLDALVEADIRTYQQVSNVIEEFQRRPDATLARVQDGEINGDGAPKPGTPQTGTGGQK